MLPNKDISAAAAPNESSLLPGLSQSLPAVRRLRPLVSQKYTHGNNLSSEPIDDGEVGQDCYFDASKGFKLNGVPIASASMKLRVRWVDPLDAPTHCCAALQPVLSHMYIDGRTEVDMPK